MEYYAKSENLQGHQETVKEHLQKVAALAPCDKRGLLSGMLL